MVLSLSGVVGKHVSLSDHEMESMLAKAGDTLIGLGLAGVVILGCLVAVGILYRHNLEFIKQNNAIQAARVDDAKAMSRIVEANSVETGLIREAVRQVVVELKEAAQRDQVVISEVRLAIMGLNRERERGHRL